VAKKPDIDVTELIPTIDEMTLIDRARKRAGEPYEFTVSLFVPARVGIVLINRKDVIAKMLGGDIDEDAIDLVFRILEKIFKPQHEFMTAEWCEKNIDLGQAVIIITQIALPIYEYLQQSGLIGKTEMPAAKNPS